MINFLILAFIASASIDQLAHDIKKERQLIVQSEVQKRGVMGVLYEINKNLNKINSDIQNLEQQLKTSKQTIESQSQILAKLEKTRETQKIYLSQRLRALYKIGYHGYAQMLLSSHSSAELARNVKFLKIITKKDMELLKSYKENIIKIGSESTKLKKQIKYHLITEKRLLTDKIKYDEQKQTQMTLLAEVENNKQLHLKVYKELKAAAIKMDEKIKDINLAEVVSGAFFEEQGKLRPPVNRRVVQKFGIMTDTKYDTKIFHKGLFFDARVGDPISAVYSGKVAFAGWVDGFGETVILDHGDHYYSIYSHNSEVSKKVGETVRQGEIIGRTGDSGSLRGPGLYFEIRHFSESLDPANWFEWRTHVSKAP